MLGGFGEANKSSRISRFGEVSKSGRISIPLL